jgi:hypothetical protein
VECPICRTEAYILEEDFAAGDSFFCVNPECRFWLLVPNGKAKHINAKRRKKNCKRFSLTMAKPRSKPLIPNDGLA